MKAADAQYIYTFAGWDKELAPVNGDVTYTAQFTAPPIVPETPVTTYTIQLVDEDGELIEEKQVVEGSVITAPATNPTKADDTQFTYEFHHWQGWTEGMTATEDMTFTARYAATIQWSGVTKLSGAPTVTADGWVEFRNWDPVLGLGTIDLSKYAKVIVTYTNGDGGTKMGDENDFFALTKVQEANPTVTSANLLAKGQMTASELTWADSRRDAVIDLTGVDYSGAVYFAFRYELCPVNVASITFIPN